MARTFLGSAAQAVRPRPPTLDPDELVEVARLLGAKEREIVDIRQAPEGRIVTTLDGVQVLIRPSGALMLYAMPPGVAFPERGGMPVYVPPGQDGAAGTWTIEDLDREASHMHVPQPARDPDGRRSYAGWVAADPVRARAAWLAVAFDHRLSPEMTARRYQEVAELRELVISSGLLDREEATRL